MAQQRRMKRQNFLAKDKLRTASLPVLFLAIVLKLVFLGSTAKDSGIAYYATPFLFVFAIAILFALTIREVIKKAVAYRNFRNQYKNAMQMIKTGVFVGLILGFLLCLIMMLSASKITNSVFLLQAYGNFPMLLTAVSVPFLLVSAALLGGFDGFGFAMPSATSRIVFAVSDLLFGILLIFLADRMGQKHGLLLHDDRVMDAFAASGAAAAFTAAVIFSTIWLLALTMAFRKRMKNQIAEDNSRSRESFSEQLSGIFSACGQPLLRFVSRYGFAAVNLILFFELTSASKLSDSTVWIPNPVYANGYATVFLWFLIPFGMTLLLSDDCREYLIKIMKKEDRYHGGIRIIVGIKQYLCTVLPMICVFAVSLLPLHQTAFSISADPVKDASPAYVCAVLVVLCFAILEAEMLRGLGSEWSSIFCSLAAFVIQTIAAVLIFSKYNDANALLLCNLIYALVYAISCAVILTRYCVYRKHLTTHLLLPLAAAFAAVVAAILCMFLQSAIGIIPAAVIALVISAIVHMFALVATGCIRESELHEFPQHAALAAIGKLLGMYS